MENNLKIPPVIKEYFDGVKPLVEMAYENKECYDLGSYYKEIRDKLLWYYGIEEMNKLYSYMSYLTKHSGDSIRNYIRATDYCNSLNGAFQKKEYNSILPGAYLKLGTQTVSDEAKKLIIESKLRLGDIRDGNLPKLELKQPSTDNDLLKKIQNAINQLSEIEILLKPKQPESQPKTSIISEKRLAKEYEFALLYFNNGELLTEDDFYRNYMQDRKVTRQAAVVAFDTLLKRGYIKRSNSMLFYCLTEYGKEELQDRLMMLDYPEIYGNIQIANRRHINASQKACLAAEILPAIERKTKENLSIKMSAIRKGEPIQTQSENSCKTASELFGVSERYISDSKKLRNESPELFNQVRNGSLTLQQAKKQNGFN